MKLLDAPRSVEFEPFAGRLQSLYVPGVGIFEYYPVLDRMGDQRGHVWQEYRGRWWACRGTEKIEQPFGTKAAAVEAVGGKQG